MKSLQSYIISETKKHDDTSEPFKSAEELHSFINEIEKQKSIIRKYEIEAEKYWNEIQHAQDKINHEFKKLRIHPTDPEYTTKFEEIQNKYKLDELINKADAVMNTPECVDANNKLYGELQQRALNSLSTREQKKINKRGGRLYNILNLVLKKYTDNYFIENI